MLDERRGLLAVYKPARLPSEPTRRPGPSVVTILSSQRAGAAVHAASRLDVGVSGVMLCTVGRAAAKRAQALRDEGRVRRRYVALAHGALPAEGSWSSPLGRRRDEAGRIHASSRARQVRPAHTEFATVAIAAGPTSVSLLVLTLRTGRQHQIRAHAAEAGSPLLGDRRYGGPTSAPLNDGRVIALNRLALHSAFLRVGDALSVCTPWPAALIEWWQQLGGAPDAPEAALALAAS